VSLLAGLYARELTVSVCLNPRLQVRVSPRIAFASTIAAVFGSRIPLSVIFRASDERGWISAAFPIKLGSPTIANRLTPINSRKSFVIRTAFPQREKQTAAKKFSNVTLLKASVDVK
jgi:hypothetical protein